MLLNYDNSFNNFHYYYIHILVDWVIFLDLAGKYMPNSTLIKSPNLIEGIIEFQDANWKLKSFE